MLQKELRDIDALMHRDIDEYHRPWRSSGVSASERHAQIMRSLGPNAPAKPSAAALKSEEAELLDLHARDPQIFEFAPWKRTGLTGAQRLYAIRSGRG
jgi:hypothetical protein